MAGLKQLLSYIEEALSNYPDYSEDQIIGLVGRQTGAPIDLVTSAYDYVVQEHGSELHH